MRIKFSEHALFKIYLLKKHGINIQRKFIEQTILNPDKVEEGFNE